MKILRKIREYSASNVRHCWAEHPVWFTLFVVLNMLAITTYVYLMERAIYSVQQEEPNLFLSSRIEVNQPIGRAFESKAVTSEANSSRSRSNYTSPSYNYLINTSSCHLRDWPVFDSETRPLFESHLDEEWKCKENLPPFSIRRVNFTWIKIDFPTDNGTDWKCDAIEIIRGKEDHYIFGKSIGSLGPLTNFANNLIDSAMVDENVTRWDSLIVNCTETESNKTYERIIPLIQHYRKEKIHQEQPGVNVIVLTVDSVSRLNFLRHMVRTKEFLDKKGFIPMYGHHKVGENTYPNLFSVLTGLQYSQYCNQTNSNCDNGFKFDDAPLIFKDFTRNGYLTTLLEDSPTGGMFHNPYIGSGGFVRQPTDYYLRPTTWLFKHELYDDENEWCYQEVMETRMYYEYILDMLEAFRTRGNQPSFIFTLMGMITHDRLNDVGYMDKPYSEMLQKLFVAGHHENSLIVVMSDHAIRFGDILDTKSQLHEGPLPFFYLYIPDSLTLSGVNANELREIARANQHRLTSHIDLHATMMHVLTGQVPEREQFGHSLLTPILLNRTCALAGIPPEFCLCNSNPNVDSFEQMEVSSDIDSYALTVVDHMNQLMSSHGNHCVPLKLYEIFRVYKKSAIDKQNQDQIVVHFSTTPNGGHFEAMLQLNSSRIGVFTTWTPAQVNKVMHITRTNLYGNQSHCAGNIEIVQMCYCWDVFQLDHQFESTTEDTRTDN